MKYKIVAVGKLKEAYLREACAEYVKRLSRFGEVKVEEAEECLFNGVPSGSEIAKIIAAEGKEILRRAEGAIIALDVEGKTLSSPQIAESIDKLLLQSSMITVAIGGSYGLSDEVKNAAALRLSFGRITLPHQLCRVVALEQLYRAETIRKNIPYHK